ncbi:MAG: WbqC family protein [Bacteroidia bacterium]
MKVAITQSNYIPWKGFFESVEMVDTLVLYDDMQYTKRDWRNRNLIKSPEGTKWLSIPVEVKGKYFQKINETRISDPSWARSHWMTLKHTYGKLPGFALYGSVFEELYSREYEMLSEVNYAFTKAICDILGIKTPIRWSHEFDLPEGKTERLVSICRDLGATEYYTGPAAKNYMDETLFDSNNITVHYYDYSGYPEYDQIYPPFTHGVSMLDLLFCTGSDFRKYMKTLSR